MRNVNAKRVLGLGLAAALALAGTVRAADDDIRAELEKVKKELGAMKRQQALGNAPIGAADTIVENKYGPNAAVTTKQGKLTLGGMVQVWFYTIQNDTLGAFDDLTPSSGRGTGDTNEHLDNDSFRIRRTELRFTMDLYEHVQAVVMIDPAREVGGVPSFSTNLSKSKRKPEDSAGSVATGANASTQPRLLQDAFVRYHAFVPHHDFQVGQYKPFLGEEGIRSSSALDFVERSMIGQFGDTRDLGLTVHGTWWEDRFQYWLGVHNSAGNYLGSSGDIQNRSNDNDEFDFAYRILLRPLWKNETWGSIEMGWSSQLGTHGEAGDPALDVDPVDGLNRHTTWAMRHFAWLHYFPGGPVKGWWLKGEWAFIKDRNAPGAVTIFDDTGGSPFVTEDEQAGPNPMTVTGFYFATGYKISDSIWAEKVPGWFKPFEFAFRYEKFDNIWVADLVRPDQRTDEFSSTVYTAGINYYIKGNNAKIQLNYNWCDEPESTNDTPNRHLREVRNDNFVVNFQVAW